MGRPEHKPRSQPDTARNDRQQVYRCRDEIRALGFRATLSWSISVRGPGVSRLAPPSYPSASQPKESGGRIFAGALPHLTAEPCVEIRRPVADRSAELHEPWATALGTPLIESARTQPQVDCRVIHFQSRHRSLLFDQERRHRTLIRPMGIFRDSTKIRSDLGLPSRSALR